MCVPRYRTEDDERWMKLAPSKSTEANVTNLVPGQRYILQVNTVSFGTESDQPLSVNQTVRKWPFISLDLILYI